MAIVESSAKDGQGSPAGGHVGTDLRALRKLRGLTLQVIAARIDRSLGWLSQVERGLAEPGISDLKAIAAVLEVPVSFFFRNADAPADEQGLIVRAEARSPIGSDVDGLREELLSPDLGGGFEMIRSVFAPGAEGGGDQPRATEEGGYVVSGALVLMIGQRTFRVGAGDSFQFTAEPCRWRNEGEEAAVVIWIVSPPVY